MATLETRVDRLELLFEQFIRRMDRENQRIDARMEEFRRQMERADARAERADARMEHADARMEHADARMEEFRRQMEHADARAERADARMERADARMEEYRQRAEQDRRELARQLGDISNRLGTIVEDLIAPSLRRMFTEEFNSGPLELFVQRAEKIHPVTRLQREFDVIAVGPQAVLVNETKVAARPQYFQEAVAYFNSGEFFEYFPEYADRRLIPVCSALYIPDHLVTYLTRQGVYAVAMGDTTMAALNLEAVRAQRA